MASGKSWAGQEECDVAHSNPLHPGCEWPCSCRVMDVSPHLDLSAISVPQEPARPGSCPVAPAKGGKERL